MEAVKTVFHSNFLSFIEICKDLILIEDDAEWDDDEWNEHYREFKAHLEFLPQVDDKSLVHKWLLDDFGSNTFDTHDFIVKK